MERHVRILGWAWIVYSLLIVGAAFAGVIVLLTVADDEQAAGEIFFLGVGSLLGIPAGYGLLRHWKWARVLAGVLALITLFSPGLPLAVYSLWVLLQRRTGELFA